MGGKLGVGLGWAVLALVPALAVEPLSPRTRMLAVEVDRDGARVAGAALRDRAFIPAAATPEKAYAPGAPVPIEVVLLGPRGERVTVSAEVPGLCLAHPADAEPHVLGDTIELHRESFIVEVPEVEGFDRVEIAVRMMEKGAVSRRVLAVDPVTPAAPLTTGAVIWPEQVGDPQVYALYGDEAAVSERINVVIVPDGYTYAEKGVLEDHARALVDYFRTKTPYKEHDGFLNYILVYAYAVESGTDQCDCGIVRDTPMSTRFPNAGYPCGDGGNRCLYYGGGCDTNTADNIVAAELRAPAVDKTIVMVNTTRYGGCGGSRAVYSAGNGVAVEIAGHELGHSLGNLADEYGGAGCGAFANELNTSANAISGAWPEWIPDLGPPRAGAQYYDACLYRPENSCEMRTLGPPFCRVCNQQWALTFFGHSRVAPTAPVRAVTPPATSMTVDIHFPVSFGVTTRLASGPTVTNAITWRVAGAPVASGVTSYQHTFATAGINQVTCEVVADTNYVKKEKNGPNVDLVSWPVRAISFPVPAEVSPPASPVPLLFASSSALTWQARSASGPSAFNLYRGTVEALASGDHGTCLAPRLASNGFDDTAVPPTGVAWTYLVTGVTSSGEGTMGTTSAGVARVNTTPCN